MTMSQPDGNATTDPVDELLTAAFERALAGPETTSVLEAVLSRIEQQQRRRTLIIGLIGGAAAVLAALGALPLIGIVESTFEGLAGAFVLPTPETASGLPAFVLLTAVVMTAGWLLFEEAF